MINNALKTKLDRLVQISALLKPYIGIPYHIDRIDQHLNFDPIFGSLQRPVTWQFTQILQ